MAEQTKYWKGIEELTNDAEFVEAAQKEFVEHVPVDEFLTEQAENPSNTNRRDFLKFLGFSVTAATVAACEAPVTKAIPYLNKPEEVTPGVANYYASTYFDGTDYASILVKTREGRPIFIKGNPESKVTPKGVNARINSSILELYDGKRAAGFEMKAEGGWSKASHTDADKAIMAKLAATAQKGKEIVILSNTIISPSTQKAIDAFKAKYVGADGNSLVKTVTYDAVSFSAMRAANAASFGKSAIPSYHFDKAKTIVSIGADFLNNWPLSLKVEGDYAKTKNPDGAWMSRHYQFESNLSLTGSNAERRGKIKPSEYLAVAAAILKGVSGEMISATASFGPNTQNCIDSAVADLKRTKGSSIVVCGINDQGLQTIINKINVALGNYGKTIDLNKAVHVCASDDVAFMNLKKSMSAGKVGALLIQGANPGYSATGFTDAMSKVDMVVSFADRHNETSGNAHFLCPDNNPLESWNDFMPVDGHYSLSQPMINPLFDTRQWQESLLVWAGMNKTYYDFVRENWMSGAFASAGVSGWNQFVHDGVMTSEGAEPTVDYTFKADVKAAARTVKPSAGQFELQLYVKSMGDGRHANNPWLHELPDPVTKVCWDNYVTMSPADVESMGMQQILSLRNEASMVKVTMNGQSVELPVVPQPGQMEGTIGIAVGYGRTYKRLDGEATPEDIIGKNMFPFASENGGHVSMIAGAVSIEKLDSTQPVASTQTHHTMMGRKIVNETDVTTYRQDQKAGKGKKKGGYNEQLLIADSYGEKQKPEDLDLWQEHPVELGHRWGMSIDLNTCTGCSACVTACHLENNVPVVGPTEVRKRRDMHWLRIDRYYSSDEEANWGNGHDYLKLEVPSANPKVVFQPVMCQHCNHAPCETVCPVAATTHSNEGWNQMAYNRCVGTRYCANNCPYKVRRFNWFNYTELNTAEFPFGKYNPSQHELGKMVLNPDVVVRTRGVMEKCSMCVQRIQAGKLDAKKAGEPVQNGAIQTACSEACPTNAIQFGDLNDKNHDVHVNAGHDRSYNLLEEVGVKPNIYYMTKVRNVEKENA